MELAPLSITIVPFNPYFTQMNNITTYANAPHYNEIHRYCVRMLKSETEAEDLTQEVYVRLYESGRNLEGSHLRNWLFRVARNLVIDKFRTKHPELLLSNDGFSDKKSGKTSDPATAIEQQDLIQMILSFLEQCDKRTREIFRLKFYECKTSSEIGSQVGISSSTVRKILLGKLQEFREAFQKT